VLLPINALYVTSVSVCGRRNPVLSTRSLLGVAVWFIYLQTTGNFITSLQLLVLHLPFLLVVPFGVRVDQREADLMTGGRPRSRRRFRGPHRRLFPFSLSRIAWLCVQRFTDGSAVGHTEQAIAGASDAQLVGYGSMPRRGDARRAVILAVLARPVSGMGRLDT